MLNNKTKDATQKGDYFSCCTPSFTKPTLHDMHNLTGHMNIHEEVIQMYTIISYQALCHMHIHESRQRRKETKMALHDNRVLLNSFIVHFSSTYTQFAQLLTQ